MKEKVSEEKVSGTFLLPQLHVNIDLWGRPQRTDIGGYVYHILNRANARMTIFNTDKEYQNFEVILFHAVEKFKMRLIAYTLMPNHFHLVLYPRYEGEKKKFMHWLTSPIPKDGMYIPKQ